MHKKHSSSLSGLYVNSYYTRSGSYQPRKFNKQPSHNKSISKIGKIPKIRESSNRSLSRSKNLSFTSFNMTNTMINGSRNYSKSIPKPQLINTLNLSPCTYQTKNGNISILKDGQLELELVRKRRIVRISGDGTQIMVKSLKDDS